MLRTAVTIGLAALPLAAAAQTYRCVGKDGKKYYGQAIPPQCVGVPIEQLNAQGLVVKRIDAQATAAERAAKEAEAKQKREEDALEKEERRRNQALLATYASEKDIDDARARALAGNQAEIKDTERRIGLIKQKQASLAKEMEFYTGKNKPPGKLSEDIKNAEIDLKAQEDLLAAKRKEVSNINAKYDEDKKRYIELTKGSAKK